MRYRSRSKSRGRSFIGDLKKFKVSNNSLVQHTFPAASLVLSRFESILDDDSPKLKVPVTKTCAHYKNEYTGTLLRQSYYYDVNKVYYFDYIGALLPPYLGVNLSIPDVSSLHNEAFQFFKAGCVDLSFDLSADLFEWKQVRALLPNLKDSFRKVAFAFRKKSLRGLLKEVASNHLAYSFGVKPLIHDTVDFVKSVQSLSNHISWLRKNSGKRVRVDFRKRFGSVPPTEVLYDNYQNYGELRCLNNDQVYHAFAVVTYDVSSLRDIELKLRYFTRQLGIDKPLSTLWELTPWSFVVDWILDVGKYIDELTPSISIPYEFHDLGWSVKYKRVDEQFLRRKYPISGNTTAKSSTTREIYYRQPGLPTSFSSFEFGDLTAHRLALSCSLFIQRMIK